MQRFNHYWIGIVLGLIIPAAFGALYLERMGLWSIIFNPDYVSVLSKVLLISAFPNMAFLFLLYKADVWKLAKGLLAGAIPYLAASVIVSL